jgi:hypothetical protein
MMTGMNAYYVSRGLIAVALGSILLLGGSPWWVSIGMGGLAMVWFLFAPRLGRYAVHPEHGVTALRRDERAEAINNAAARNAFVASMLALGAVIIYARVAAADAVAILVLEAILLIGVLVYDASDFWMRRAQS